MKFKIGAVVFIVALSIIASAASAWWFSKRFYKEIVVIDMAQIIQKRQEEFMSKFQRQDITSATVKEIMQADINRFADRLNAVLLEESANKLIFTKGSVITDTEDITEPVYKKVWKQ